MTDQEKSSNYKDFSDNLQNLSEEDRNRVRRELTGESSNDLIKRGAVYNVLRKLRTSPSSLEHYHYQKAISDILAEISKIDRV